jgi:hypothetical protein
VCELRISPPWFPGALVLSRVASAIRRRKSRIPTQTANSNPKREFRVAWRRVVLVIWAVANFGGGGVWGLLLDRPGGQVGNEEPRNKTRRAGCAAVPCRTPPEPGGAVCGTLRLMRRDQSLLPRVWNSGISALGPAWRGATALTQVFTVPSPRPRPSFAPARGSNLAASNSAILRRASPRRKARDYLIVRS